MIAEVSVWYVVAGVVGAGVLITLVRDLRSVFHDYAYDALLSFADEFFGGALGLDFGDWVAAILLYRSERHRVGKLPAALIAWEATNFIPISFIPGVGTVLEVITNFFPAATITNLFFNKQAQAKHYREQLDEIRPVCDVLDVSTASDEADAAFDQDNWVEAAHKYQRTYQETKTKVERQTNSLRKHIRQDSYDLLQDKTNKTTETAKRVRIGVERIKDLLESSKQQDSLKERVKHIKTAEKLLEQLRT